MSVTTEEFVKFDKNRRRKLKVIKKRKNTVIVCTMAFTAIGLILLKKFAYLHAISPNGLEAVLIDNKYGVLLCIGILFTGLLLYTKKPDTSLLGSVFLFSFLLGLFFYFNSNYGEQAKRSYRIVGKYKTPKGYNLKGVTDETRRIAHFSSLNHEVSQAQFDQMRVETETYWAHVEEGDGLFGLPWRRFLGIFSHPERQDSRFAARSPYSLPHKDATAKDGANTTAEQDVSSSTASRYLGDLVTNNQDMAFAYMAPGTFTMGSESESPRHEVTIAYGFYLQTKEVTQAQWLAVMGENPSHFNECDACPVEMVSWDDIQGFIQKLNQIGAYRYRLPSEAEWEYACRAGTDSPFAFGDCLSVEQANFNGSDASPGCRQGEFRKATIPVGSLQANAWGLYDMHGNVWEWCEDVWHKDYRGAPADGQAWVNGDSSIRVLRGGSWLEPASGCRSAKRIAFSSNYHNRNSGFRLVLISME
jgi:formylglycine-generating enzyme required for sulfatase activity